MEKENPTPQAQVYRVTFKRSSDYVTRRVLFLADSFRELVTATELYLRNVLEPGFVLEEMDVMSDVGLCVTSDGFYDARTDMVTEARGE